MEKEELEINAALQIGKPANEIYNAIIEPERMKNYFISSSSGRMEEGKQLIWRFPEFDMDVPVRVGKIERDKYISFFWMSGEKELKIEIQLLPAAGNATLVRITEGKMMNNEAGIKWLKSNTEGWGNFLACLKAYLEFGINLRKGGYDHMRRS